MKGAKLYAIKYDHIQVNELVISLYGKGAKLPITNFAPFEKKRDSGYIRHYHIGTAPR